MPTQEEMIKALQAAPPDPGIAGASGAVFGQLPVQDIVQALSPDIKNFAQGGVHGVLKGRGVGMPDWANNFAGFLQNPDVNSAMNVGAVGPTRSSLALGLGNKLHDKELEAFLEKNPGGSILDFSTPTMSSPIKKIPITEKLPYVSPRDLPSDTQWYLPKRAIDAGFNVAAHHGTDAPKDFSMFRLPQDEIGVHFGSPRAAHEIMGNVIRSEGIPRVYPVGLQAKNPLQVPDAGNWYPSNMMEILTDRRDLFPSGALDKAWAETSYGAGIKPFRDLLSNSGYDSLKYRNTVEDPGHISHIMFKDSPTHPGYVRGVRSPWAAYKDLDSANILSSAAMAAALGGGALGSMKER